MMAKTALVLLGFVIASIISATHGQGCPFAGSMSIGRTLATQVNDTKYLLIDNGYTIEEGQPANVIWGTAPLHDFVDELYTKTNALLMSEQLFMDQLNTSFTVTQKRTVLQALTSCVPVEDRCKQPPTKCDPTRKFPTITGECNNLEHPKWGSQFTAYGRVLPAHYDDGIHTIRKSVTNHPLPSPRLIGNEVLQHSVYPFKPPMVMNYNSLLYGQLIAHDTGLRDVYQNKQGGDGLRCCSQDYSKFLDPAVTHLGCMPIEVPKNDPFYKKFGIGCLSYMRTQPIFDNECRMGAAEKANSVTAFTDLSVIYGSEPGLEFAVRSFKGGQLLLEEEHKILARAQGCTGSFCYFTGDGRGSFFPTLTLLHSVWVRYHNIIAEQLALLNKHWSENRLYQETKRIITALYQNIVYNEWLPYYIGPTMAERRKVSRGKTNGYCGKYDPTVDASTTNEFAVAAFRLFHVNTPEHVSYYDENYKKYLAVSLADMTTKGPEILETDYMPIFRGLLSDPAIFSKFPQDLRNTVFKNGNKDGIGMDLLSVDISRNRDHGLAPYHEYLKLATGQEICNWFDYFTVFSYDSISKLQTVYKSPLDIDLLVGLLLEEKYGQYTGVVAGYLIEEQFYRSKFGNRFHYSHPNGPYPMSEEQINEINRQTYATMLCATTSIENVVPWAFEVQSFNNKLVRCSTLGAPLNLKLWQTTD